MGFVLKMEIQRKKFEPSGKYRKTTRIFESEQISQSFIFGHRFRDVEILIGKM